jgi:DNA polymerase I-like protein with 3'-5' exonuclease and polymerase domains
MTEWHRGLLVEFVWILSVLDLTSTLFVFLHDGIWFICPIEIREKARALIQQVMENSVSLSVPLAVTFD